ncbi:hypothetical protein [Dyadobacter bucti]|uniref:hypothetical protein n=1 Tax=Dyadobacter bucti TaxID=2572203 RepID=UPI003F727E07
MQVKNKEYRKVLKELQEELDEYERQVQQVNIKFDLQTYRDKLIKVYELKFLDVAILRGADEGVQYGILNMRLEERQAERKW